MAVDGIFLSRFIPLLENRVIGRRIMRTRQISKTKFSLEFGKKKALIISIHPQFYRISLETLPDDIKYISHSFIMRLRKYIQGGFIRSISQIPYERTVFLNIENTDEIGNIVNYRIAIELMGQFSNLILLDANNIILSAARQMTTKYREILSNVRYVIFGGDKLLPDSVKIEDLRVQLSSYSSLSKGLTTIIAGISKRTAQEIIYRAGLTRESGKDEVTALQNALNGYLEETKNASRVYVYKDEMDFPIEVSFCQLHHLTASYEIFDSVFEGLEWYFHIREARDEFTRTKKKLLSISRKEFEDTQDILYKIQGELEKSEDYERYKIYGDLLSMHYGEGKKGLEMITLSDYEGNKVTIPLDPALSLSQNIDRYYGMYKRLKRKKESLKKRIVLLERQMSDMGKRLKEIEECEDIDKMKAVKEEIEKSKTKKKETTKRSSPREFFKNGYTILIGKSNKQNDELTFKIAKKDDIWLHTQAIPGSHVVIRNPDKKEIPFEVLKFAACLAATYSRAQKSSNVPVDYTKVKNVWKPRGAKPGFVLYKEQKTLFVNPLDRKEL
ncbi:MAG: hypothetical protein DRP50_00970 [Thermotoga sp.]|nr:MAG: hypothetical protein DRP50_00970 [Thermotoga sp.]